MNPDNSVSVVGRDVGIDQTKTAAIACVLLIHASTGGFWSAFGSADWFSTLFWSTFSRAAVPLFLMCSGALFLTPDRVLSIRKLYGKYILRIFIALVVWGIAYKLIEVARNGAFTAQAVLEGFRQLLRLEDETHLYYLRIMLVFYAFLPMTRLIARHATKRELQYLLGLWFILGILMPTMARNWPSFPISIPAQWPLNTTYSALGYGFLGYYLKAYPVQRRIGVLTAAAGFVFVFGVTGWLSIRQGSLYNGFLEGISVGVCLQAAGSFIMLQRLWRSARGTKACRVVSRASFCIYLVHFAFLHLFLDLGWTVRDIPCAVAIPLTAAAAMLCSFAVWLLLRRIPFVRTYLI